MYNDYTAIIDYQADVALNGTTARAIFGVPCFEYCAGPWLHGRR